MRKGTYSIVARDPASGDLGVAVQSHWFSVGSVVTWGLAGVAVVATQSVGDPAYGPRTFDSLSGGHNVQEALQRQLDGDPLAALRQVAVVDVAGAVAVHTGADCIPCAGHIVGDGFACQANMMARDGVPEAMAAAFSAADGPLAERLVAALDGAQAAGGDVRGKQSAALLVVPAVGEPWDRVELRVEDHPEPLAELRRLLVLQRAYALAAEGDELEGAAAAERYLAAVELAPEVAELRFWAGLSMAQLGDVASGAALVRGVIGEHRGWAELLERLTQEIAPGAPAIRAALHE